MSTQPHPSENNGYKPDFLKSYFWEIDFSKLDYRKYPVYVIERVLEYGDTDAVRWLFRTYTRQQISDTLKKSRVLSVKSANFWAEYLNLNKGEVKCLTKQFLQRQKVIWPH